MNIVSLISDKLDSRGLLWISVWRSESDPEPILCVSGSHAKSNPKIGIILLLIHNTRGQSSIDMADGNRGRCESSNFAIQRFNSDPESLLKRYSSKVAVYLLKLAPSKSVISGTIGDALLRQRCSRAFKPRAGNPCYTSTIHKWSFIMTTTPPPRNNLMLTRRVQCFAPGVFLFLTNKIGFGGREVESFDAALNTNSAVRLTQDKEGFSAGTFADGNLNSRL